ncbi:hypothetical protein P3W24_07105 [Luteibacter sp. PPL201]|uniref:Uncharacterized protein n=1 Tax=Luteibacter sahnii TaxID=3021977 RepID=A0ABT6B9D4_9GAMM
MKLIQEKTEHQYWLSQIQDDSNKPFETLVRGRFSSFLATGYAGVFKDRYVRASQEWEAARGGSKISIFFTIPDPDAFASATGYFGGMVFSTTDDAGAVEKTLYAPQAGEEYFSIYEASERTYLVPESNTWMAVADRASWLALYCFTRSRDRDDFLRMFPHLNFFDSMNEARAYAKSMADYGLQDLS